LVYHILQSSRRKKEEDDVSAKVTISEGSTSQSNTSIQRINQEENKNNQIVLNVSTAGNIGHCEEAE
jgi:hypothetical protein